MQRCGRSAVGHSEAWLGAKKVLETNFFFSSGSVFLPPIFFRSLSIILLQIRLERLADNFLLLFLNKSKKIEITQKVKMVLPESIVEK